MQLPLQVSFRHMERSPVLEATIREKAAKLDTFAGRMMSCRVVVEPAGKHRKNGNEYGVRIDVKLPGGEVVATHKPSGRTEFKDIRVAIRDAFDSAARQLEDYVRIQRGDVKAHRRLAPARVSSRGQTRVPDFPFRPKVGRSSSIATACESNR